MADRSADEAAIRRLMDRYGAGVDDRAWEAWGTIFDDPLVTDFSRMDPNIRPATLPRAQHVAQARAVIGQFTATHHMITNVLIDFDGPDRARARAAMRAEHWLDGMAGGDRYTMFGVYENGFRRTAEGWRISHLALRLAREEGSRAVWAEAIRRASAG